MATSCLALALWSAASRGAELLEVQRGVHPGFELFVFYSDTLEGFELTFDRVRAEIRVGVVGGRVSAAAAEQAGRLTPGASVLECRAESGGGLTLKTAGPVFLRQYLVNGPPALLLDVSRASDAAGPLPFELSRDGYLRRGGEDEAAGRLDLALKYVEHAGRLGPVEPALTHRAGIIRHKLGHWEQALADFARTERVSGLSADAHARQAMIYLALGDTAASGRSWAGYFHAPPKDSAWEAAVVESTRTPEPVRAGAESETTAAEPSRKILKAGGEDNMYLGWGFLLVGMVALIGLLAGVFQRPLLFAAGTDDSRTQIDDLPPLRFELRPELRRETLVRRPTWIMRPEFAPAPEAERYSSRVVMPHPQALPQAPPRLNLAETARQVPADEILKLSAGGAGVPDIAHRLGLGRDEVTMVINLDRLARGTKVARQAA